MNKKIGISVAAVLSVLAAIVIVYLVSIRETTKDEVVSSNTISSSTLPVISVSDNNGSTTEQSNTDEMLKPEPVFENNISIVQKTEDDYEEDPESNPNIGYTQAYIDKFEFSDGFLLQATKNTAPDSYLYTEGRVNAIDGVAYMKVSEENANETDIATLREDILKFNGWNAYLELGPISIIHETVEYTEDGMADYQSTVSGNATYDVTRAPSCQLLADETFFTAFGECKYVAWYSYAYERYEAHAFIYCEDVDRILHIQVCDQRESNLYYYVIELTNDGIIIIK